jgi:hypothetical protein
LSSQSSRHFARSLCLEIVFSTVLSIGSNEPNASASLARHRLRGSISISGPTLAMDRLVLVTVQATDRPLPDTVLVMARPVRTIAATGNVVVDGGIISPADFEHGTDASRAGQCRTVSASRTAGASRSRPCTAWQPSPGKFGVSGMVPIPFDANARVSTATIPAVTRSRSARPRSPPSWRRRPLACG